MLFRWFEFVINDKRVNNFFLSSVYDTKDMNTRVVCKSTVCSLNFCSIQTTVFTCCSSFIAPRTVIQYVLYYTPYLSRIAIASAYVSFRFSSSSSFICLCLFHSCSTSTLCSAMAMGRFLSSLFAYHSCKLFFFLFFFVHCEKCSVRMNWESVQSHRAPSSSSSSFNVLITVFIIIYLALHCVLRSAYCALTSAFHMHNEPKYTFLAFGEYWTSDVEKSKIKFHRFQDLTAFGHNFFAKWFTQSMNKFKRNKCIKCIVS